MKDATVRRVFLSCMLFICGIWGGCEGLEAETSNTAVSDQSALTTAGQNHVLEALAQSAEKEPAEPDVDTSLPPDIQVTWTSFDEDVRSEKTEHLRLTVRNNIEVPATVTVSVRFAGLLSEVGTLDLGTIKLKAFESRKLQVPYGRIPLQTTTGICQAIALVEASYNDGARTWISSECTEPAYYQHGPGYSGLQVFDEEVFLKEHGGTFIDLTEAVSNEGLETVKYKSIGRIDRDGKGLVDLTLGDIAESAAGENPTEEPAILLSFSIGEESAEIVPKEASDE